MSTVAIQGAMGSYSEEAAYKMLGKTILLRGYGSFFETFEALLLGTADYAVVPVKNTVAGEISSSTEIFKQTNLRVLDHFALDINHMLVGTVDSEYEEIESVRSHVEALKQCQKFLKSNLELRPITGSDTGSSIRRIVADQNPRNAAIGSYRAAEFYGGKILVENVADQPCNQTTFHLIGN